MAWSLSGEKRRDRLLVMPGLYTLTGILAGLAVAPFAHADFNDPWWSLPCMGASINLAVIVPCALFERGWIRILGASVLTPFGAMMGTWMALVLPGGHLTYSLPKQDWANVLWVSLCIPLTTLLHHVVLERRRPFPVIAWIVFAPLFLLAQIIGDVAADAIDSRVRYGSFPEVFSGYWRIYLLPHSVVTGAAIFAGVAACRWLLPKEASEQDGTKTAQGSDAA